MNRIKELRKEKGVSLRDVGEATGISYTAIGMAERGKRGLNNQDLEILTKYFGVSADYLLGFSDMKNPSQTPLKGIQLALYEGTKDLSDEQLVEILKYAEYIKYNKK